MPGREFHLLDTFPRVQPKLARSRKEGRSPNRPCQWLADGKALSPGIIDPSLPTAEQSPPLLGVPPFFKHPPFFGNGIDTGYVAL